MAKNFTDDDVLDDDPTDELPILTDVFFETDLERTSSLPRVAGEDDTGSFVASTPAHGTTPPLQPPVDDTALEARTERIAALETELANLEQRWRETGAELADRNTELEQLHTALSERNARIAENEIAAAEASAAIEDRDAQIALLHETLDAAQKNINTLEDAARALEQQIAALEALQADAEAQNRQAAEESVETQQRETLAALAQHIENRNEVWQRQIAELEQKSVRIRELEIELAQRQTRQQAAEHHAEMERTLGIELRAKLAAARELIAHAQPASAETDAGERPLGDRAELLRVELRRAIQLQSGASDDTEDLRRLEDLEAAIRELEHEMDSTRGTDSGIETAIAAPPSPPMLVCLTGDDPGNLSLDESTVTIGRGGNCGIRIATHYVSREHARLSSIESQWFIEDLGSRNGVFVNAVRVDRQALAHNDLITIGDTQFRFQAGDLALHDQRSGEP